MGKAPEFCIADFVSDLSFNLIACTQATGSLVAAFHRFPPVFLLGLHDYHGCTSVLPT